LLLCVVFRIYYNVIYNTASHQYCRFIEMLSDQMMGDVGVGIMIYMI
jgi:hypothetical protein